MAIKTGDKIKVDAKRIKEIYEALKPGIKRIYAIKNEATEATYVSHGMVSLDKAVIMYYYDNNDDPDIAIFDIVNIEHVRPVNVLKMNDGLFEL